MWVGTTIKYKEREDEKMEIKILRDRNMPRECYMERKYKKGVRTISTIPLHIFI